MSSEKQDGKNHRDDIRSPIDTDSGERLNSKEWLQPFDKKALQIERDKIKLLSDDELLDQTNRLVKIETKATTTILHHLKEIDDRRLYAEKNCDSLFTYCTRILRYSESQAHRRITAARLLRHIPQLDEKIEDGRLSLTNVAQAQSFFRYESRAGRTLSPERKIEILTKLEDKSSREAERILVAEHPEGRPVKRESIRFITKDAIEMKIIIDPALLQKLTRVRVLTGHKIPDGNWADIIEMMCEDVIERLDPIEKAKRAALKESKLDPNLRKGRSADLPLDLSQFPSTFYESTASSSARVEKSTATGRSRQPIPNAIKHKIWLRDDGRCAHKDPLSGVRCGSSLRVEIDHIKPVAVGGGNEPENLRLLCRAHNQRRNVKAGWNISRTSEPP